MPEDDIEKQEIDPGEPTPRKKRRWFRARNLGIGAALLLLGGVVLLLVGVFSYRYGVFDTYIKAQFITKMSDIGIVFDADVFAVTVAPLELVIRNATFNDKVTGEKLFFIREARLGLSVENLYAWQLSRDIAIETTEIDGAEVWITFDENGRSNFANLTFVEDESGSRVNFKYDSVRFSLRNGTVHVGDISRSISGDGNNVTLSINPVEAPTEGSRYEIELASTGSEFVYDGHVLEPIDIRGRAIANDQGAEITELHIETPIGVSTLNGTLTDWASLRYELNVESTVDLTQTSNTFPLDTTLRGVANFRGKVSGSGETYRIEGVADSQALSADGIYLKAVNVDATVAGTNANYEANGRAVAELLTFNDFRIEFPRLAGNVRGTGTDFRWVGELQAAAVKSGSLTFGGLFLSDAVAELNDGDLTASAGNGRAQRFAIGDIEFEQLAARNLRIANRNGTLTVNAPSATAGKLETPDYRLDGVTGRDLAVRNQNGNTTVDIKGLTSQSAELADSNVRGLRADSFTLTDRAAGTDIALKNVQAAEVNADGTRITGVESPSIEIVDRADTQIYSNELRVAKVINDGFTLGSLNIGGVRLSIREGRVEGTSNDINAGTIAINQTSTLPNGGTLNEVRIIKPVFVVEPSGRYRASADMSIGGGIVGQIPLGNATASVNINNDRAELNNVVASVMEGSVNGNAVIAFNNRAYSEIAADFVNLDLGKVLALQSGRVIPIKGQTTGRADITFRGTDFTTVSGDIRADITATAGTDAQGQIPVTGVVDVSAVNGLFTIDTARLRSTNSELTASGRFDLRADDSNLQFALNSTAASEIDRIFRVLGVAPDVESQLDSMQARFAGNLAFNGTLTGNFTDPTIVGRATLDSLVLRERNVGSVAANINVSPLGIELRDGVLQEPAGGGSATFAVTIPYGGTNNTSVQATLNGVNAGNLLAALPVTLPERIRDFNGKTSGTVRLNGLPNNAAGSVDLTAANGTVAGQAFDNLRARADFRGTNIDIENAEIRFGDGFLTLSGDYDRATTAFDFNVTGKSVPLPLALSFLPQSDSIPTFAGLVDVTARAMGEYDRPSTYNVNFNGTARDVVINDNAFGVITFNGQTTGQILTADLAATLDGRPQPINATLNFGDDNLPFRVESTFNQSPLGPFFALIPQLRGVSITGTGTGRVEFGGNLSQIDASGNRVFSTENLTGSAQFSNLALRVQDTPLEATEPVVVRFNPRAITFESARFAGGGSNATIGGTAALADGGVNNLAIDGRINLSLLNVVPAIRASDTFFGGIGDVSIRLTGTIGDSQLSGSATLENASVATFVGADRLTFDRLNGRILFTSNQAQIERLTGFLGGGQFTASGGALFTDDLQIDSYRVAIDGNNVTVPYPPDFITTGDARIEITGQRIGSDLTTLIRGDIRARRSIYTQDIDLATVVGARREASLSTGGSSVFAPRFDLTIEGRDALVVQNNLADLTASASLRITGTADNPIISGRIVANGGQVFFRRDRYDIQRGVLEFPPNTEIDPIINLQAETEIGGYQIFVNLRGPLTDTELLNATVRSSPALPQADVISLITTGSLSNTESGIPTLAQTGINTAAEVLTDSIINEPVRRATDRLFGLNVFEIDPIISGERLNATARLTVGRQINNNLRVTYSTNLSQDQNQVLALEYRVSNRLSLVAQYEQRSLSNVTRARDNFSFYVRFRRRF